MKLCAHCGETKSIDQFYNQKKAKDGKQSWCKACMKQAMIDKYADDPEYRERNLERTRLVDEENRRKICDYLTTHPCIDCGEDDIVVLDFDHRGSKVAAVSALMRNRSWERVFEEIQKCDVRCANCHRRKTAKDFSWFKATYRSQAQ